MKHTPGKWQYAHREGKHGMWSTDVFTEDGETVCTMAWYPMPMDDNGVIGTYRQGNAALCAAAPALLEALKEMVAFWLRAIDAPDGTIPTAEDEAEVEALARKAQAAIQKAETRND